MLEHFEIAELEEKWNLYNKKKGKLTKKFTLSSSVVIICVVVSVFLGVAFWLLSSNSDEKQILKTAQNITQTPVLSTHETKSSNKTLNIDEIDGAFEKKQGVRGELNFNSIGVDTSVDAGGFVLNNTYKKPEIFTETKPFASVPKDEIIDFGNPPSPPKSLAAKTGNQNSNTKGKVIIKTAPLRVNQKSLEEKFYASNDILYSLKLAQNAYDNKNYDEAIKWALISNEIDKNSPKSWIIFAKANYKKGNKQDALIALENFNSRISNPEVIATIKQMKNGDL